MSIYSEINKKVVDAGWQHDVITTNSIYYTEYIHGGGEQIEICWRKEYSKDGRKNPQKFLSAFVLGSPERELLTKKEVIKWFQEFYESDKS